MAFAFRRFAARAPWSAAEVRFGTRARFSGQAGRSANAARKGAASVAGALAGVLATGTGTALCLSWPFGGSSTVVNGTDYQSVYADIAETLDSLDHDDGSFGPIFVRLAWHAAGTYSKADGTGGSDHATMRYAKESTWGANAGLGIARARLEAVKAKHPSLTYADLWSLAGVVAIQEMGGPVIPWRPGRSDSPDDKPTPPDGRLPDATKGADHLRDIFYRMGFSDAEVVALSGAHALGRCHTDRSGFVGPWNHSPTTFSNMYYRALNEETWVVKKEHVDEKGVKSKWTGPLQYTDAKTGTLMMLPTDMVLTKDAGFKPWVDKYAADQAAFFADFVSAFTRLQENGVKAFAGPGAPKPLILAKTA